MREYIQATWLHLSCFIPWFERHYGRTCQHCGARFYTQAMNVRLRDSEYCYTCLPPNTETTALALLIYQHNLRALWAGLPGNLTIGQWRKTLADFGGLCAYCQAKPYADLEHFIPVEIGGGTTAGNCVPSCRSCNSRKKRKHPDALDETRWYGRIGLIRAYLATR